MSNNQWDTQLAITIIKRFSNMPGGLIECMHALQAEFGCVPEISYDLLADGFNLSKADVYGVKSFYHDFRDRPAGKMVIKVCQAEACQAMGSRDLTDHVKNLLDLDMHSTSPDGRYTLAPVYCLGNCATSPNVMVDDRVYGRVSHDRFDQIIEKAADQ